MEVGKQREEGYRFKGVSLSVRPEGDLSWSERAFRSANDVMRDKKCDGRLRWPETGPYGGNKPQG
jgi:hypothetical protein